MIVTAFIEANLTVSRNKIDALSLIGKAGGAMVLLYLEYPPPSTNSIDLLYMYHLATFKPIYNRIKIAIRCDRSVKVIGIARLRTTHERRSLPAYASRGALPGKAPGALPAIEGQ
jgi:hypothetical protein